MLLSTLHALVAGFVKRTWFVAAVAIVVCGGFAAHALDALAAARRPIPTPGAPRHPATASNVTAAVRAAPDGTALVTRNMFCSTCAAGAPLGPTDHSVSASPAVLIATSLATRSADSRATVRVLDSQAQGSWGLGERIPGVGTIARIGGTSIDVLDGAGHVTRLSLLESRAAGGGAPGAATPGPTAAAEPFADRIRKLDAHTYEVDRDFVRELVSGAARPGGARMMPIVKDGEVGGVRLSAVRATSLPAAIGMRNGDVIDAIDGDRIKSAQQLLDLYARLDQLAAVELQGTRAGKPLAIMLRLR